MMMIAIVVIMLSLSLKLVKDEFQICIIFSVSSTHTHEGFEGLAEVCVCAHGLVVFTTVPEVTLSVIIHISIVKQYTHICALA